MMESKGISLRELLSMSGESVKLFKVLPELYEEAEEAEKIIAKKFETGFGPKNRQICVYSTSSFGEYEGHGYYGIDNKFVYRDNWWGGRSFELTCTAEGIYSFLRSCYLRENGMRKFDPEEFETEIEHPEHYFRDFVKKAKSELET